MENLVFEGFKFMVLGMGTVFAFLIIMIMSMNILSYVVHKFFPEPIPTVPGSTNNTNTNAKSKAKIAAISAAVQHHEASKGKNG